MKFVYIVMERPSLDQFKHRKAADYPVKAFDSAQAAVNYIASTYSYRHYVQILPYEETPPQESFPVYKYTPEPIKWEPNNEPTGTIKVTCTPLDGLRDPVQDAFGKDFAEVVKSASAEVFCDLESADKGTTKTST